LEQRTSNGEREKEKADSPKSSQQCSDAPKDRQREFQQKKKTRQQQVLQESFLGARRAKKREELVNNNSYKHDQQEERLSMSLCRVGRMCCHLEREEAR
jgi:hypothetical protein